MAQLASAPRLGRGGPRFKSEYPDQLKQFKLQAWTFLISRGDEGLNPWVENVQRTFEFSLFSRRAFLCLGHKNVAEEHKKGPSTPTMKSFASLQSFFVIIIA